MSNILWIASYPKSGNTWVRAFVHNLLVDPDRSFSINNLSTLTKGDSQLSWYREASGHDPHTLGEAALIRLRPEVHNLLARSSPDTSFVKTHNALFDAEGMPTINREVTAGAIYIVRNPLDIVVSYSHHLGDSLDAMIKLISETGFETPLTDKTAPEYLSDWTSHVKSWTAVPHPAFHVVRYEDLAARPVREFGAMAKFLKVDVSAGRLKRAVKFSSFRALRAQEDAEGFTERTPVQKHFFRRGRPGEWRKVLSPEQVDRIVDRHRDQMAKFDYLPLRH